MEKSIRRAAHASQGVGPLATIRRPRRGRRRAHAAASGPARAGRLAVTVAVLALVGTLVALAPVAPASAATTAGPAAVPSVGLVADVPGHQGWFDGVEALFEDAWDNAVALGEQVLAELEVQLAQIGDGVTHLWGMLP